MRKMWRNRETNKNEVLAGLCLLFAIGGIMLAGFGTKTDGVTTVISGDETRHLTDDWENVEYSEGEKLQLTQEEQGQATQEAQGQTAQEAQGQTVQKESEQAISKEQATQEETEVSQAQENQEQVISQEQTDTSMAGDMTGTVVVQAGDSLWKIAERYLGDGSQYIAIYEQNCELIGDDPRFILAGIELKMDWN